MFNAFLSQGKHVDATALLRRALVIRMKALGEYHEDTVATQRLLKNVEKAQVSAASGRCEDGPIVASLTFRSVGKGTPRFPSTLAGVSR